jgi:hypothetical protein
LVPHAREVLREEGLPGIRLRALDATVYRRVIVVRGALVERPAAVHPGAAGVEYSELRPEEASSYAEIRPETPEAEVRRRLDANQSCLVGRLYGRLVHARWADFDRLESPHLGISFALLPTVVHAHDVFTAPAARRRGISAGAGDVHDQLLRERGMRTLVSTVWPGNVAGMAMQRPLGRTVCGSLVALRLGPARMAIRRGMPSGLLGQSQRFAPAS